MNFDVLIHLISKIRWKTEAPTPCLQKVGIIHMGAMFEVVIISKKFIPFQAGISYLQGLGFSFLPEKMQCIQDWTWRGQRDLDVDLDPQTVKPLLDTGCIVLLYGTLAGITAGIFVERNEDGTYQTDCWFEEKLYQSLNIPAPLGSKSFYEQLETQMEGNLTQFAPYGMVLAVMGEEIVFDYCSDLTKTRKHCRVDRWISGMEDEGTVHMNPK